MQVELKEPTTFEEAARYADRVDNILTRVSGQGSSGKQRWANLEWERIWNTNGTGIGTEKNPFPFLGPGVQER